MTLKKKFKKQIKIKKLKTRMRNKSKTNIMDILSHILETTFTKQFFLNFNFCFLF